MASTVAGDVTPDDLASDSVQPVPIAIFLFITFVILHYERTNVDRWVERTFDRLLGGPADAPRRRAAPLSKELRDGVRRFAGALTIIMLVRAARILHDGREFSEPTDGREFSEQTQIAVGLAFAYAVAFGAAAFGFIRSVEEAAHVHRYAIIAVPLLRYIYHAWPSSSDAVLRMFIAGPIIGNTARHDSA